MSARLKKQNLNTKKKIGKAQIKWNIIATNKCSQRWWLNSNFVESIDN